MKLKTTNKQKKKKTNFGVISLEPASCGEEHAIILDLEKENWLVFPLKGAKKMEFLECEGKGRIVEEEEKVFIGIFGVIESLYCEWNGSSYEWWKVGK